MCFLKIWIGNILLFVIIFLYHFPHLGLYNPTLTFWDKLTWRDLVILLRMSTLETKSPVHWLGGSLQEWEVVLEIDHPPTKSDRVLKLHAGFALQLTGTVGRVLMSMHFLKNLRWHQSQDLREHFFWSWGSQSWGSSFCATQAVRQSILLPCFKLLQLIWQYDGVFVTF